MSWSFKSFIKLFTHGSYIPLLLSIKQGLEKEMIRINPNGSISSKKHPMGLGSKLTHPFTTTDFAEAQLEFVTPPLLDFKESEKFLRDVHIFVISQIGSELLWPFSMPPKLPPEKKICIAEYGPSHLGKQKELYRKGLVDRYGFNMQMISGIHLNFSFREDFWDALHSKWGKTQSKQDFISNAYLHIIRNFYRFGWIVTYLFGASPAFDRTYYEKDMLLFGKNTCYGKHATSFRMSNLGYYSRIQSQLAISYDSLKNYIKDLHRALITPHPKYKAKNKQFGINRNILQIVNEHYTRIRPKQTPLNAETPLDAIKNRGISYLEIRSLDNNPYLPLGISTEETTFLHLFLIYCLAKESPALSAMEIQNVCLNQDLVALQGRDPKLRLNQGKRPISLKAWALSILQEMSLVAKPLDAYFETDIYQKSLSQAEKKCERPQLTPSGKLIQDMFRSKKSFQQLGLHLAKRNTKYFQKYPLSKKQNVFFTETAKHSFRCAEELELKSQFLLKGYEDLQLSTQIVIREALSRNIKVEVLDRDSNFICLTKGKQREYLKEATKTSKDSYISSLIMENKLVTKVLLKREGISVPEGGKYTSLDEALLDYPMHSKHKIVIKPNLTNFGIGISFVSPGDKINYKRAVKLALEYDSSVLIEQFIKGKEYRFLFIGNCLIGVTHRDPANVIGDGKKTIEELANSKNLRHKLYEERIQLGEVEQNALKNQSLTIRSVPKKGKKIYLRENSNISTGGDPIDMTDKMPQYFKDIALRATKAIGGNFCGVDMIIESIRKQNYAIIEMNFNPMLSMHEYPYRGKKRNTGKTVLDFLGF